MLVISQLLGVMFAHHKAVFYLYVYEVAYGQFKDKMSVYMYTAYYTYICILYIYIIYRS